MTTVKLIDGILEYPTLSYETLVEPKLIKSGIGSASFAYGLYCIGACLCIKFKKPLNRSLLVSIPAGVTCFGVMFAQRE